jgi:predicted ArsR family transcriptional regulator
MSSWYVGGLTQKQRLVLLQASRASRPAVVWRPAGMSCEAMQRHLRALHAKGLVERHGTRMDPLWRISQAGRDYLEEYGA